MYSTARNMIRTGLAIGVLLLAMGYGGCATHKASVDLNGDGIRDEVIESPGKSHYFFVESRLQARLSKPDGTQQNELLAVFNGKPENIQFKDIDKDGDLPGRSPEVVIIEAGFNVSDELIKLGENPAIKLGLWW